MKKEQADNKTSLEIIEDAMIELDTLPDLIQLFIGSYKLDQGELTQEQKIDLGNSRKELYSLLTVIQRRLWDINKQFESICLEKGESETL